MPLELYIQAVLTGTAVFGLIKFFQHCKEVNIFYRKLEDLFIAYYKQYPNEDVYYFQGIVVPKLDAYLRFWEKDMNNFITDHNLLQELFAGAKKYTAEETQRREDFKQQSINMELECPWCGNLEVDKFLWFDTSKEDNEGQIQCQECYMFTPLAGFEDCVTSLKPCDCEDCHEEN